SVFLHKILVPPGIEGKITSIVNEGDYTIREVIAQIQTASGKEDLKLTQRWPVRIGRPYKTKIGTEVPLYTGQRVIDTFFPVAKGGTGAIPGGFGTGKTVTLHQLAKWADAEIIVYVGCGERGNEMTEVLEDFPKLKDPKSGKSLMERTLLVANTSNMPVAAREASIYTGITLAEYFRDQGYNVALMADSTSRWAEALREISGRLEEMPGEEGYPAYLGSRLADFYERAGRVKTLGTDDRVGSVTVTGAVSPAGGDFSEPVTQSTLRITKVFWALDKDMASRRFFPAINYLQSYSLYKDELIPWYSQNMGSDWPELTEESLSILQRDKELREIVQLVGPDALPERERAILEAARMVKEDYLMQSALHPIDTYCPESKSYWMLKIIMNFWQRMRQAIDDGIPLRRIIALPVVGKIARMKVQPHDDQNAMQQYFKDLENEINNEFISIEAN
ncbi:MAG: V-type ATP synthase subunit A, partial [Promethearchaeota archaeon]